MSPIPIDARRSSVSRLTIAGSALIVLVSVAIVAAYPPEPAIDWLDILQEGIFLLGGIGALWASWRADSPILTTGALLITASLAIDFADEFIGPAVLPSQWIPTVLSAGGLGTFAWGLSELATRERKGRQQLRSREREIERYQAQLEVVSMKDEFVATISHELRTPLTAVIGAADVLENDPGSILTAPQRRMVNTISTSAEHLLAIINDILEFSRLEQGRAGLTRDTVAIREVCEQAWGMVAARADAKGQQFELTAADEAGTLATDRRRLLQALVNLLDNAIKFTPAGGRIGLQVERHTSTGTVSFVVWDTGRGISRSDQERLFEPFVQLDSGLNREHGGTGLGLALVRRTARALGGDARVASAPGEGSRFTMSLPLAPPSV